MNMSNEFLNKFLNEFNNIDKTKYNLDTEFKEIDDWDSLTSMALVSMIQDTYDENFSDEDLTTCITIRDVLKKINQID